MFTPIPIRNGFEKTIREIKEKIVTDKTQSETIFEEILHVANLDKCTPDEQYKHIDDILMASDLVHTYLQNNNLKPDVSVIGKISEYICELALKSAAPGRYCRPPKNWDWVGDYELLGAPFNLFISVKSYAAKERLIVSGTGQLAAPVIGWGLFNDKKEWSPSRVKQYKQRGFLAIYMPRTLYKSLDSEEIDESKDYPVTKIVNIYGQPLIRKINAFADDVRKIYSGEGVNANLENF